MPGALNPKSRDFANIEYKTVGAEMKAEGDEGVVKGHYSVFGNVDDGGDIVHRGAFTQTIQERGDRVQVFYAHDWMKTIASPPDVLREDEKGLYAEYKIVLDSFWGGEAWALIKAGALKEGSFGFRTITSRIEKDASDEWIRHLDELKLLEISPVPLGMNPLTSVEAVKALLKQQIPLDALSGENNDPYLMLAKQIDAMASMIEERRALITADPQKASEVAGSFKALADLLNELSVVVPSDPIATDHTTLKLAERAAAQKLALLTK